MAVKPIRRDRPTRRRASAAAGSLRETLLEAAIALIAKKGPQGFSLREVARRARVSEAAPYWHFADREALLAAVAERGFLEMERGMAAIREQTPEPLALLQNLGVAYVRFALAHPSYLRVMFGPEIPDKGAHPALDAAGTRTFELLVQAIARGQAAGHVRAGDPADLAVAAWALVHGLASLVVDGRLRGQAATPPDVTALAERVTHTLLVGLSPR